MSIVFGEGFDHYDAPANSALVHHRGPFVPVQPARVAVLDKDGKVLWGFTVSNPGNYLIEISADENGWLIHANSK